MRLFLLILVLNLHSGTLNAQENPCKGLKKGKYLLLDATKGNTQIKRNKRVQIEEGEKSCLKLKLKITWLDDCNYSLTLIKVLDNPQNIYVPENMVLKVKIIEINYKSYTEISSSNLGDATLKRTILKMSNR